MSNLPDKVAGIVFKLWLVDVFSDDDLKEILKKLGYLK